MYHNNYKIFRYEKEMSYKDIMDLWFVWMPILVIIIRYIKGVVDNWNED